MTREMVAGGRRSSQYSVLSTQYSVLSLAWLLAAALLLPTAARADAPPIKNRPDNFSDAVGTFEISMAAKPTTVRFGQPLTLTVRVTATGPVQQPPRRTELRDLPTFRKHFYIENLPGPDDDPASAGNKNAWEFTYRLKPRTTHVDAIPSLPFVYYKPASPGRPLARGSYQTRYAPRIELTVQPPETETTPSAGTPEVPALKAPESVYRIVEGPAVLRRPSAWDHAGPVVAAVALAGVPLLCAGWYVLWRRRYPDAARLARKRRSLAARQALRALEALPKQPPDEQARQAAAIVALYLRERVELTTVAPTPEEAALRLRQAGLSAGSSDAVADFLRSCDAARFAPEALRSSLGAGGWAGTASDLILTLEEEPCLAQAS
jgi:hypothetical protein